MKLPGTFVPNNKKDLDLAKLKKKHKLELEEIIPPSVQGFGSDGKFFTKVVDSYVESNEMIHWGVKPNLLRRIAVVRYDKGNKITLVEYKSEEGLSNSLEKLVKKGKKYFSDHYNCKFTDKFLYKSDITIYLYGSDNFTQEVSDYYKFLGFKKIKK